MKSQFFTSISNVLLLSFTLCISELMTHACVTFEESKIESKVSLFETEADVLNPIYIFK